MSLFTPLTLSRLSSLAERQTALYQIYHQVLERQPYAFERQSLAQAETDFLSDKIGVKRFLKHLGLSNLYLDTFYHNSSNLKFIELCFKHFLGRAPLDYPEIRFYSDILLLKGVSRMISELIDSEEYRKAFGCFTIPYPRQHLCQLPPKSFLDSQLLNHEHIARRGRSLPTLFWQQLGLRCDSGVCYPQADEPLSASVSHHELSQLLQLLQQSPPAKVLATLSPQQIYLLHQASSHL